MFKTTREAFKPIENNPKVRYSRNRSNASRMNATSSKTDERIDKLADQLSTLVEIVSKKVVTPAPVKAVEENWLLFVGAILGIIVSATAIKSEASGLLRPREVAQIPPPVTPISIPEPDVPKTLPKTTPTPESDIPKSLPKPNIPYPSRRDDQKSRDKASNQWITDEPALVCSPPPKDVNDEKEKQEVKNLAEPTTKRQTRITPCLKNFKVICKKSIFHSNKTPQVSLVFAITSTLSSIKPKDSLIIGDEHLSIFCAEEIVSIPRESEDTSKSDSKNVLPSCDDLSSFNVPHDDSVTFSNPLFEFDVKVHL
ncbi:hypothetical protein Tco_0891841 [Tanacetum coccineum]|uniref:Uncharacterized protein n=1 Tax=Tanacetum coccineum TaxID=301880 RepID=A0ABQ5C5T3_9ASTR